jgi:hypothetical protein
LAGYHDVAEEEAERKRAAKLNAIVEEVVEVRMVGVETN